MKTKLSLATAVFALALAAPTFAAETAAPAPKKEAAKSKTDEAKKPDDCCQGDSCCGDEKPAQEKKVSLTGSHLPQKVSKVGRVTDSASPVMVLSREELDRTGASDVASALRKYPMFH